MNPEPKPAMKLTRHVAKLRDALKCPVSRCLIADPVVAGDGFVYERMCIEARLDFGHVMSPTTGAVLPHSGLAPAPLALAALVLLEEIDAQLRVPAAAFVRVHGKWRLGGTDAIFKRHTTALQETLLCPITRERMQTPATTVDGHVFERQHIERWFALGHATSPMTGILLLPLLSDAPLARALQTLLDDTCATEYS